ncbi:MAG: methylated-DNA--[protein]-cysteine S-methyltransferase [Acidimicrobiia bacterium]|nr:methylated-DNA--[protein]-cysteine S-methyltransferase [Acidimicrobiia bacterium]
MAGLAELTIASPVGALRLVASDAGLRAVLWPGDDARRVPLDAEPQLAPAHPVLAATAAQLGEYFDGSRQRFDIALDVTGTEFQLAVWRWLDQIPVGTTATYRSCAHSIGRPGAARAVGAANARNPLSIVWPCHRLVGGDGSLRGFAGGLQAKSFLLAHERTLASAAAGRACAPDRACAADIGA